MLLLFVLAVAAVVLAVDLVLGIGWMWVTENLNTPPRALYVGGALGTLALILGASAIKAFELREGGEVIAKWAGGRRVASDTQERLERRLLNIVEEMAIASGVRVPKVFVMDTEPGINAFAAGYDVSNAVIAVTRGALERLNRDELQGVIGHEFSHILNGDMWLNIRMMGVLAGIVFIGSIGQFFMRNASERRGDNKGFAPSAFFFGLALFVIGYIGLFFARLIKAAISRQREFLADASSVQFTRNPDGLAGALDQIRASPAGALISGRYAEELSHMFFGQGVSLWLAGLFDTHPPLDERIRRVRPGFQSARYRVAREAQSQTTAQGRREGDAAVAWGRSAGESMALVGSMPPGKIDYAARVLAALPEPLREGLRNAEGAAAAMIALLLAPKEEVRRGQLGALHARGLSALVQDAEAMAVHTQSLGAAFHLPVVDLAIATMKTAPDAAKAQLLGGLEAVICSDRRVSLHEFVVFTLVREQLAPRKTGARPSMKIVELREEAMTLLLLMAHAGVRPDVTGGRQAALEAAIQAGAKEMELAAQPAPGNVRSLEAVSHALTALKSLAPLEKARLIKGLFAAVSSDGTIRLAEAELMRLAGAVLDCPLPPLIEQSVPYATR